MRPAPSLFYSLGLTVHLYRRPLPTAYIDRPCTSCIITLDMLPRSLLTSADPLWVSLLPHLSPSVFPPFSALNIANVPANPCGWSLIGSIHTPTFPQTTPLPCCPQPAAWSLLVPRRVISWFTVLLSSCPPPSCSLFSRYYADPSLDVFRWFVLLGALLRTYRGSSPF